uniref:Immunoglobulin V-set domain-containing protein n=1 Tax=Lates calcarifer TaxID=8187 RepID=A0A4W6FI26_LATCA
MKGSHIYTDSFVPTTQPLLWFLCVMSFTVSCPYEEGYTSHEKYLCRNDCAKNYDVVIRTSEGEKGRYSIHDDNKNQVFTVTISDLYPTDAGKYWCGVTRFGMDPYTAEVKLEVEFLTQSVLNRGIMRNAEAEECC